MASGSNSHCDKRADGSTPSGTGLGLSFCRDVIEQHQGRIRVDSTVGRGTAFTLKLPAVRQSQPVAMPVEMGTNIVPQSEHSSH